MAKIHKSYVIEAHIADMWEYIRDFNGLPKWFPGVTDSHIEAGTPANQAGCIRNFGLEGGPRIREQLLALSDQHHECTYKMIECPLPITNYSATVKLSACEGGSTSIEITSQFDCPPAQEHELVTFLGNTYEGAFDMLKLHFKRS
jgi:polyketide cyclase/dehydrase/lipid transport protein